MSDRWGEMAGELPRECVARRIRRRRRRRRERERERERASSDYYEGRLAGAIIIMEEPPHCRVTVVSLSPPNRRPYSSLLVISL